MADSSTDQSGQPPSLRGQVYRSGRFLVARQLTGMVIKMVGILVVTGLIGPEAYGLFAAAAALAAVLSTVAIFGIDVHLVRNTGVTIQAENTAFTVLFGSSLLAGALGYLGAPLLGFWLQADEVVAPARVIAGLLPIMVLSVPARARLERDLRFAPLAATELAADLAVYAVAVPLAVAGAGVWAPIGGFAARHAVLFTATYRLSRYRPRLQLQADDAASLVRFGGGYSAGKWLSVLGQLVNPIVVGRLLGPVGVGHVALMSRIIEQLGAVKQATMRLAVAAFARLEGDRARFRSAHAEGVLIQVIGSVPLYAVAAFAGPWIVPALFGSAWLPATKLLALLAVAASVGTLFNLAAPILRVLDRNGPVAVLRACQVSALLVVAILAVPVMGPSGYGLARMARTVPFVLVHRRLATEFTPDYRSGGRWLLAFLPMMASPWLAAELRPVLILPVLLLLGHGDSRREVLAVLRRFIASR